MAQTIPLSTLGVGCKARLHSYPVAGAAFLRLREMGMIPGTLLTLVRTAPMGDPLEIEVRGYRLTLRRSEAEAIAVEPNPP